MHPVASSASMIKFYFVTSLLHFVYSRNDDLFNYRETEGRDFGPEDWDEVTCDDVTTCTGWPDDWQLGQGWKLRNNDCEYCPEGSNRCGTHHQSPIDLERNRAVTGDPMENSCIDVHWMKYEDSTCTWDMLDAKRAFSIERHALKMVQPLEYGNGGDEDIRLDCEDPDIGRLFGRIDFSKGFSDWWFLSHIDFKVPSEHTQEGKRYSGEVQMAHFYSLSGEEAGVDNEMATVSIFLEAFDDYPPYAHLDRIICEWRKAEDKTREECGLPSVGPYPGCFEISRGHTSFPSEAPVQPSAAPIAPTVEPTTGPPVEPSIPPVAIPGAPVTIPTEAPVPSPTSPPTTISPQTDEPSAKPPPTPFPTVPTTPDPALSVTFAPIVSPALQPVAPITNSPVFRSLDNITSVVSSTDSPSPTSQATSVATSSAQISFDPRNATASTPSPVATDSPTSVATNTPTPDATDSPTHRSHKPHATTDSPTHHSQKPHATTDAPTHPSQKPHATTDAPTHLSHKPHATTDEPTHHSRKPHATTDEPTHHSRKPHAATESQSPQSQNAVDSDSKVTNSPTKVVSTNQTSDIQNTTSSTQKSKFRDRSLLRGSVGDLIVDNSKNGNLGKSRVQIDPNNFRPADRSDQEWADWIEAYSAHDRGTATEGQRKLLENDQLSFHNYQFLIDVKTEYYFRYSGTSTIPPCYGKFTPGSRGNTNHWRVLKDPVRVNTRQIEEMERLLRERIAPPDDNSKACKNDTAGKVERDGHISVARPLMQYHESHYKTFCECQDWPSKWPEDRAWCDLNQGDQRTHLYEHPYNFESSSF